MASSENLNNRPPLLLRCPLLLLVLVLVFVRVDRPPAAQHMLRVLGKPQDPVLILVIVLFKLAFLSGRSGLDCVALLLLRDQFCRPGSKKSPSVSTASKPRKAAAYPVHTAVYGGAVKCSGAYLLKTPWVPLPQAKHLVFLAKRLIAQAESK